MPRQDKPSQRTEEAEGKVRLRPILGVRPGVYLTVLYAVVLLLLVYLFLLLPGLRHRGNYLSLTSFPDRATVTVDGVYAGSTPCRIFVRTGTRTVELSKPYYQAASFPVSIRGRVFATLLVPDVSYRTATLHVADVNGLVAWALADYQKNPEIPRILSDASWAAADQEDLTPLYAFLSRSMSFVSSDTQLRELLLAAARTASRGGFFSPAALVSLAQQAAQLSEHLDNAPAWLVLADRRQADTIAKTSWFRTYAGDYAKATGQYYHPGGSSGGAGSGPGIAGMAFQAIPAGDLVMGADADPASLGSSFGPDLLHAVHVQGFYLGSTEVSNAVFERFLAENPDWSPGNSQALMGKGMVTDGYLPGWSNGQPPAGAENLPVTGVSWYAATAFCDWLSKRVSGVLPGYVARLPRESEWEWAARGGLRGQPYPLGTQVGKAVFASKGITGPSPVGASEPNGYGLRDMIGNVWEWCLDTYTPTTYLLSSFDPATNLALEKALPDGPDRAVRGGGWGNQPGAEKVSTRGSQPADWCTPYLGFRVALARD